MELNASVIIAACRVGAEEAARLAPSHPSRSSRNGASLAASSAPARHASMMTEAFSSMTPLSAPSHCPCAARCVRPDTTQIGCDLLKAWFVRYSVMVAFGSSTGGCVLRKRGDKD